MTIRITDPLTLRTSVLSNSFPIMKGNSQIAWLNMYGIDRTEGEAYAQLFTASPDLLASLERLVLAFDVGDMCHTTLNGRGYSALNEARQAIAKAYVGGPHG